jgi:hypothetical protein
MNLEKTKDKMIVLAKASINLTHWPTKQVSSQSRPRLTGDTWSHGLGARQSRAGNDVSKEEEGIVGFRYEATTGEDTPNWEDSSVYCNVLKIV